MSGYEDEGIGVDSEIDEHGRNLTQQRIDEEEDVGDAPVAPEPAEADVD